MGDDLGMVLITRRMIVLYISYSMPLSAGQYGLISAWSCDSVKKVVVSTWLGPDSNRVVGESFEVRIAKIDVGFVKGQPTSS